MKNIHFRSIWAFIVLGCFLSDGVAFPPKAVAQAGVQNNSYYDLVRLIGKREHHQAVELGLSLLAQNAEQRFELFEQLIQAAKASGKLEETQRQLESLRSLYHANARLIYGLALANLETGNSQQAINGLKLCVSRMPNEPLPLMSLIRAHHRLGQANVAAEFISEMIQQNPDNASAYLANALHLSLLRQLHPAIEQGAIATRLVPAMPQACFFQTTLLAQADKLKDSIEVAKQCLQVSGEFDLEIRRDLFFAEGRSYAVLGEYTSAIENLMAARAITQTLHDSQGEMTVWALLGSIHWAQDFYAEAISEFHQSLAFSRDLSDRLNEGKILANLGSLHHSIGNYDFAERYLKEAWAVFSLLSDNQEHLIHKANIWARTGLVQIDQAKYDEAKASYKEALRYETLRQPQMPQTSTYNALVALYLKTGDLDNAGDMIRKALTSDVATSKALEPSLITLALSGDLNFKLGQLQKAEKDFEKLRELSGRDNPHHLWKAYAGLAWVYQQRGLLNKSLESYEEAIKLMEDARLRLTVVENRAFFFQDKVETYRRFTSLLMNLNKVALAKGDLASAKIYSTKAFHISERARARSLLDSLSQTSYALDQKIPADLRTERKNLLARFSQLDSQHLLATNEKPVNTAKVKSLKDGLDRVSEALREWQNRLRLRDPRLANLRFPEPLTAEQVQLMLKGN